MIATIPFLMLLITLIRIVFPDAIDSVFIELERILPEKFSPLFSTVYTEISSKNTASVLSFSAITMFWSSSRGVAAVTRGVAGVYGTRDHVGLLSELVRSLFYTVAFMALIIATLVVLVFRSHRELHRRKQLSRRASHIRSHHTSADVYISRAAPLFFSLVYSAVSGNGRKNASANDRSPRRIPPSDTRRVHRGIGLDAVFVFLFSVYRLLSERIVHLRKLGGGHSLHALGLLLYDNLSRRSGDKQDRLRNDKESESAPFGGRKERKYQKKAKAGEKRRSVKITKISGLPASGSPFSSVLLFFDGDPYLAGIIGILNVRRRIDLKLHAAPYS